MAPGDGAGCVGLCERADPVRAGRDQQRSRGGFDARAAAPRGAMEIVLADGDRVIVDRTVDGAALARVIEALSRR